LKESYDAFAVAVIHARTESDPEKFNDKLNESCKVLLELDSAPDWANQTMGPGHFNVRQGDGMAKAPSKPSAPASSADPAATDNKAQEKKKGFLTKVKDFLVKAGQIVLNIAKSGQTYKVLAIGATMVILGVIASAIGGWVAVGFAAIKGVLGLVSVFKGAKELMSTKDFAAGKQGIAGVSEWIKKAKDPKNAAKIILSISQIALGAWGASSAVGQVMTQISTMEAMKTYNPQGSTQVTPQPHQDAAPAKAAPAPEAPKVAPNDAAPAAPDLSKYAAYGASKASEMQIEIQRTATSGDSEGFKKLMNGFAEKIGAGVTNGKISEDQAKEILKGFANEVQHRNGGVSGSAILNKLLSVAHLK
jgi:hypothetical protein